jgi:neutral ceramidase
VTFVGANPRNNLRLEGTYTSVETFVDGAWTQIKNDKDWEVRYEWKRVNGLTGTSDVTITWDTSFSRPQAGRYRIRYFGDSKAVGGAITAFEGSSAGFSIV